VSARSAALLLSAALLPAAALAADLPGWDRTRWGMTSREIASLYDGRAVKLDGRIEFNRLYTDVALRHDNFAGLDFTVYFQMDDQTGRLAQVLLERRRQYATAAAWDAVLAALERQWGEPSRRCDKPGEPLLGKPLVLERVWALPSTVVHASFLDFGVGQSSELSRRLLIRYAPNRGNAAACS
jgi:hypothetical protein